MRDYGIAHETGATWTLFEAEANEREASADWTKERAGTKDKTFFGIPDLNDKTVCVLSVRDEDGRDRGR